MSGTMRFEFRFRGSEPDRAAARRAAAPMRILVMGDLSGRAHRGETASPGALADRPVVAVDHETLGDAFRRFAPSLRLELTRRGGPEIPIELRSPDDFHPDELYSGLGLFQALRETRQRLDDPATFRAAATALGRELPAPFSPGAPAESAREASTEDEASMLSRLLGSAPSDLAPARGQARQGELREEITQFVRGIVAPYVVPGADPRREELVAGVDDATSELMRDVIHHPAFQELESLWRSVQGFVSEVETGEELRVFLLDATREELEADARAAGADLEGGALYRLLVGSGAGAAGGEPWTLIVGAYAFGPQADEVALLGVLGAIASRAGGPLLAGAAPGVLGCRSLAQSPEPRGWKALDAGDERNWAALRASPWARWIGLALPRVLLRLPYGRQTDRTERFEFEEFGAAREHEAYLWGNPAFACATLLARSFAENGWAMHPGDHLELDGLPAHAFRVNGESRLQPCAEVMLTERAADTILGRGVTPLLSFPDRNAVRVARFQSLADPPLALAGAWS